jgi:type 1 glutamine amidotransferase
MACRLNSKILSLILFGTSLLLATPSYSQVASLRLRSSLEKIMGPIDTIGLANPKALNIVWVYSIPAEGTETHNFEAQMNIWKPLFGTLKNVTFTPVLNWPTAKDWQSADIVVLNFRFGVHRIFSELQYADLDAYLDRGKALIPIHVGVALQDEAPKRYSPYIGLSWQWDNTGTANSKDRAGPMIYTRRANHPLAFNLPDTMQLMEETYFNLFGDTTQIQILNTSLENVALPGEAQHMAPVPVMWTKLSRNGKVFVSVAGHFTATHNDAYFRLLLLRGMAWASGEKFDRFRNLVTLNANVKNDIVAVASLKNGHGPQIRSIGSADSKSCFWYGKAQFEIGGRLVP